jgi:hypothetical protein
MITNRIPLSCCGREEREGMDERLEGGEREEKKTRFRVRTSLSSKTQIST